MDSVVKTLVSVNVVNGANPPFAANTARSRALVPITIAGRGLGFVGVEIMPKGMLLRPKWESSGIGIQESESVSLESQDMTEFYRRNSVDELETAVRTVVKEMNSMARIIMESVVGFRYHITWQISASNLQRSADDLT